MTAPYTPTDEEYEAAKQEIQRGWSRAQERKRRGAPAKDDHILPVVKLKDAPTFIRDVLDDLDKHEPKE